jgi:hypothetical protein
MILRTDDPILVRIRKLHAQAEAMQAEIAALKAQKAERKKKKKKP